MTENFSQIVHEAINAKLLESSFKVNALMTSTVLNEIGIDSLSTVDLILSFAERYQTDIEIALEGHDPPRTVGDLVKIVTRFANGV